MKYLIYLVITVSIIALVVAWVKNEFVNDQANFSDNVKVYPTVSPQPLPVKVFDCYDEFSCKG